MQINLCFVLFLEGINNNYETDRQILSVLISILYFNQYWFVDANLFCNYLFNVLTWFCVRKIILDFARWIWKVYKINMRMQMNGLANWNMANYEFNNNEKKTYKLGPLNVKLYVRLHQLNTSNAHNLSLSVINFLKQKKNKQINSWHLNLCIVSSRKLNTHEKVCDLGVNLLFQMFRLRYLHRAE